MKKIKVYNKLLEKYKSKREFIKINRTVTEGEANIFGIILDISNDFMQIAENDEFKFNGEIIIRVDHFDSIRCNKFDKTYRKILQQENKLSETEPRKTKLDLTTWESVFTDLMNKDIHVIIECEDLKKPSFTIGPIKKVNRKSVEIRNYDATGELNRKLSRIKYKNITLLKFNEEYSIKNFSMYVNYY